MIWGDESWNIHLRFVMMDGIKAGHRIRDINKNVIIIFITGFAGFALNAFEIRVFDYLLKPINFTKLEKVIKEAVIEIELHKILIKS